MTPRKLAALVIVVYWTMLLSGLALYASLRLDDLFAAAPIMIGAIAGTLLGHGLALFRFRIVFLFVVVFATMLVFGPHLPHGVNGSQLWLAFLPAALCAYWSLGDRTAIAAFWFPAMVWMLSILDRTDANMLPDASGIAMLGGIAALFVWFLRVREARRVALWRTVAITPLATSRPAVILAVHPALGILRGAWALAMLAFAVAATAWFAPKLWHPESLVAHTQVASHGPGVGGLPCCPVVDADTPHARIKEYFNVGRGHAPEPPIEGVTCQPCTGDGVAADGAYATPIYPNNGIYAVDAPVAPDPGFALSAGASGIASGGAWGVASGGEYGGASEGASGGASGGGYGGESSGAPSGAESGATSPSDEPIAPAAPPAPVVAQAPVAPEPPHVTPPTAPTTETTPPPTAPTVQPPPPMAPTAPTLPPATAQPPPPPPTSTGRVAPHPNAPQAPIAAPSSPPLLAWIAALVGATLVLVGLAFTLRPLRRLVTLRHLRRPYWDETVDQRISNSWQLALVGLRDAGWRATEADTDAPRAFAQRVRVDGIDTCATILERARHGLCIDADDLDEMSASADLAYRSARARMSRVARAASWLRWPL